MLGIWNEIWKKIAARLGLMVLLTAVLATAIPVASASAASINMTRAAARAKHTARQACIDRQIGLEFVPGGIRECLNYGNHDCFRESLQRPDLAWCDSYFVMFDHRDNKYLYCAGTVNLAADGHSHGQVRVRKPYPRWVCSKRNGIPS